MNLSRMSRSLFIGLSTIVFGLCMGASLHAQELATQFRPTAWPSVGETAKLGPFTDYIEDATGALELENVKPGGSHHSMWIRHDAQTPNFGFTKSVYWFRMQMEAPAEATPTAWLLRIAYPLLDQIDIHLRWHGLGSDERTQYIQLGDSVRFSERQLKHRQFLTPIEAPEAQLDIYMRVATTSSMQVPMEILAERDFLITDESRVIAYGLLFGSMLIMILYNIIIFLWTREANYLTYCIYALGLMLLFVALTGLGFQYLWPESLIWHEKSQAIIIPLTLAAAVAFNRSFLALKSQALNLDKLGFILFALCILIGFVNFIAPYSLGIKLGIGLLFPACLFVIFTGFYLWKRGYKPARYYLISWAAVVIGAFLMGLNKAGALPMNMITDNALIFGAVAQLVLLSYALADKVNQLKADKEQIQRHALAEQKHAADKLQLALTKAEEANQLKSEFLANISHELRTPLNAIVNLPAGLLNHFETTFVWSCSICAAQFQSESGPAGLEDPEEKQTCPDCQKQSLACNEQAIFTGDSSEQIHFLKRIESSGRHLLAVVNDLLDISKLEADHMKIYPVEVNVSDVLSEVAGTIQSLADEKNVELVFEEIEPDLRLEADRVKVAQILINLIGNAIKFTPAGGSITTRVCPDLLADNNALRFEVADTGEGIPEEYLNIIFESFRQVDGSHTRQHHGTGLGLAICSRLVELHGGRIDVASTPGQGSRFWFILPLENNASQEKQG
ncbi:MAG: hypothetical protein HOK28_16430 [Deltaproteobacteria bacterium]|jgi:signal transduction histidine kinase|nr:hypothetical protein [Deltaproteobacteria bacterium]